MQLCFVREPLLLVCQPKTTCNQSVCCATATVLCFSSLAFVFNGYFINQSIAGAEQSHPFYSTNLCYG